MPLGHRLINDRFERYLGDVQLNECLANYQNQSGPAAPLVGRISKLLEWCCYGIMNVGLWNGLAQVLAPMNKSLACITKPDGRLPSYCRKSLGKIDRLLRRQGVCSLVETIGMPLEKHVNGNLEVTVHCERDLNLPHNKRIALAPAPRAVFFTRSNMVDRT